MDKKKIVHAAREKIREQEDSPSGRDENVSGGGQKSLLGDVLGAFMNIVGDASNDDSDNGESTQENRSGKTSGRKPQGQGRVASVGSRVADQLRGNKK